MGIQASVSDVKVKHGDANDSDDEDVEKEEADAQKGSVMKMSKRKMRKRLKNLMKIMDSTSDEEEVDISKKSKKRKKVKEDTSDEEFNEVTSVKDQRKKRVVKDHGVKKEKEVVEVDLDKADEVSSKSSQKDVKSKTRVKGKIKSGGYFEELTTDDEKNDNLKFKKKVVNDVKKNADPEEDSVKMENRSHYKDALGNILLVMQACFVVLSTRSCGGCAEVLKALERVDSHLDGWHVMDVYKPHKARMTVKTSSYGSNHLCYQLKSWMTCGTELRWLMCQGKRSCKEMTDSGKLMAWKLVQWKEGCLQDLKERWKVARKGLASGFARVVLWDQEVDVAIGQGSSRCLER